MADRDAEKEVGTQDDLSDEGETGSDEGETWADPVVHWAIRAEEVLNPPAELPDDVKMARNCGGVEKVYYLDKIWPWDEPKERRAQLKLLARRLNMPKTASFFPSAIAHCARLTTTAGVSTAVDVGAERLHPA